MTMLPWITTPALRTWSRISRSETSSSAPPRMSTTPFPLFAIGGDERVRRPGSRIFDAMRVVPFAGVLLQHRMKFFPLLAWDQVRRLELQVALGAAEFAPAHLVECNVPERFGKRV